MYLQRVLATKKVYLFYQDSLKKSKQPEWRLMNMHVLEEFLNLFPHPESFDTLTQDNIPATDVTTDPEITLRLKDISIKELRAETITMILQKSQYGQENALPQQRNRLKKFKMDKDLEIQKKKNPNAPIVQQKLLSNLVGAILYQSSESEEIVQGRKQTYKKAYILYFESTEERSQMLRAIYNGKQWGSHYDYCRRHQMQPNQQFLHWIIEHSNQKDPQKQAFLIDFKYFHDLTPPEELEAFKQFTFGFKYIWSAQFFTEQSLHINNYNFSLIHTIFDTKNLTMISLSKCYLDDAILKAVLPQLKKLFFNLNNLNLSYNLITDQSLEYLSLFLPELCVLSSLDLSHNLIEGEEEKFSNFLHSINLSSIREEEDSIYEGFKLFINHNQLKDSVIRPFEKYVVFAKQHQFFYIDISHNKLSSYGLWRLFSSIQEGMEYITSANKNDSIIINMFPLPFNSNLINSSISYFYKIYLSKKLYEQQNQKEYDQLIKANQNYMAGLNNQINSAVNQDSQDDEMMLLTNHQKVPALSMQIERKRYQPQKPLPNKQRYIIEMEEKIKEIKEYCQYDKTIEDYKIFCQSIFNLEFEFPLAKLEKLQQIIWNKLMESFLIRDHYSISILMECSNYIGLDVGLFEDYFSNILKRQNKMYQERVPNFIQSDEIKEEDTEINYYTNVLIRKQNIIEQIQRFLNFEDYNEDKINSELDYLVSECLRLDLRGNAVEMLFLIKEKRDIFISRKMANITD